MNTDSSNRLHGFDWLRFWAIVAVVCIHSSDIVLRKNHYFPVLTLEGGLYYAFSACLRFCVPVFLMMAAFLNEQRQASKGSARRRWKRYAFPLLIANAFYFLITLAQARVGHQPLNISGNLLFVLLTGRAYYHTWFLYNLLAYTLLHSFLRRLAGSPAFALVVLVTLLAFANPVWLNTFLRAQFSGRQAAFWMDQWLFWQYMLFGAVYYTLGIWAANNVVRLQSQSRRHLQALLAVGLFACCAYGLGLRVSGFFNCGSLLLSCAVFCLFLQVTVPPPTWIARVGSLSLGIYLWHPFVLLLLRIAEGRLYREAVSPVVTFLVMALEIIGGMAGGYAIASALTRIRALHGLAR